MWAVRDVNVPLVACGLTLRLSVIIGQYVIREECGKKSGEEEPGLPVFEPTDRLGRQKERWKPGCLRLTMNGKWDDAANRIRLVGEGVERALSDGQHGGQGARRPPKVSTALAVLK